MKKYLLLALSLILVNFNNISARDVQDTTLVIDPEAPGYVGVNWVQADSIEQLFQIARKQNKPLFVDFYTSHCGGCIMMLKQTFPKKEVGDYMNENFVCGKLNCGVKPSSRLANEYHIDAVPTFLIFSPDSVLIHRTIGYMPSDEWIKDLKEGIVEQPYVKMKAEYDAGNRDREFLKKYIELLTHLFMNKPLAKASSDLLETYTLDEIFTNNEVYSLFEKTAMNPESQIFLTIYSNKDRVLKEKGQEAVDKLEQAWERRTMYFFSPTDDGGIEYDQKRYDNFKKLLDEYKVPSKDKILKSTESIIERYSKK